MVSSPLVRARIAVSMLFAVNGIATATWLPRLAQVQVDLGLGDAQLGVVLACGAAGGLIVGPLAGVLVARSNSARVSVLSFVAIVPALPMIGLVPSGALLALVLFWLGAVDAVMDGAMNAHGLRVQSRYGRSVINGFHGFWSLGTVAGAVIGTVSLAIGLPIAWMMAAVAGLSALGVGLTARWLLPGPDPDSHPIDEDARAEATSRADPLSVPAPTTWRRVLAPLTALLGLFTLLTVIIEDVPARWSSVYLTDLGASAAIVGVGFTAFTVAMTVGRFGGDRLVNRFGEATVVRSSMAIVGVVLGIALLIAQPWAYVVACVVIGLGVATLFPAAMHAATRIPGVRPAMGVATVGWLARAGFVVAPLAVGAISERFGIGWGLTVPIVAAFALVPLSAILRERTVAGAPR